MRRKRLGWLWLPLFCCALLAACGGPKPAPPEPSFSIVAPHKTHAAVGPDAHAQDLGRALLVDVERVQACNYQNPGCDPDALQRTRDEIDGWKVKTHCTVLEIKLGATGDDPPTHLRTSGENAVIALKTRAGLGAAAVIDRVPPGIELVVDDGGPKPVTYFGLVVLVDCAPHPQPGLGDTT